MSAGLVLVPDGTTATERERVLAAFPGAEVRSRAELTRARLEAADFLAIYYRDADRRTMAWAECSARPFRAKTRLAFPDPPLPSRYLRSGGEAGSLGYDALRARQERAGIRVVPWRWGELSLPYLLCHLRYERLLLRALAAAALYLQFWTSVARSVLRHPGTAFGRRGRDRFRRYAEAVYHAEDALLYANLPRLLLFKWLEGELFREVPRGSRVLEVGVDNGRISELHFDAAPFLAGTDYVPAYLREHRAGALSRFRFLSAADMRRLPFRDGAFDTLLSAHVIDHAPDAEATVREAARVLAPGGRFAFSALTDAFLRDELPFRWLGGRTDRMLAARHLHNALPPREWTRILREAGFEVERMRPLLRMDRNAWHSFQHEVLAGELGGMFRSAFWRGGLPRRLLLAAEYAWLAPLRDREREAPDDAPSGNVFLVAVKRSG